MSMISTAEFKVGALVVSIGALIALMSLQVSDDPAFLGRTKQAWFYLDNANGLTNGSAIRSAGIPVGSIKDIKLKDGKAMVLISVKSDVNLTESASVEMRANGILGDKYIEVYTGKPGDKELSDRGQIIIVNKGGALDDVMSQVSEITGSLKEVTKNLNEAITNDGTNKHILGRIVRNIEKLTADVAQMTSENKAEVREIVKQVHGITKTLDESLNDNSEEGFKKVWKRSLVKIDKTLANLEDITNKINKGEGTIGKLVSDEKTADDVAATIDGLSGLMDTANKVTTGVDFNGYYLNDVGATKSTVGIQIQPGLDRYYYLGIVTDPAGVVERTLTSTTTNGTTTTNLDETKTYKSKTKFTALYAKNIYDFTLKGGLIENTGGVGFEYLPFGKRLVASIEAYDFEKLQLRTSLTYRMRYGFYFTAGYNDILDKRDARTVYGGAGIFLTNDDLKLLLTKSPF